MIFVTWNFTILLLLLLPFSLNILPGIYSPFPVPSKGTWTICNADKKICLTLIWHMKHVGSAVGSIPCQLFVSYSTAGWFQLCLYDFVCFRKSSTVQCRTQRATRFCWLLWSAVDWIGVLCVSTLYCTDDEISSAFSKVLTLSFQM